MGLSRVVANAPVGVVLAFGLVVSACNSEAPDRAVEDSRGAADTAGAVEALVATDATEAPPTLFEPELYGLEDAEPQPLPLSLGFDAVGADLSGPQSSEGDSGEAAGSADGAVDESPEGPAPTGGNDGVEGEEVENRLPMPPPAGLGSAPAYDDPSEAILSASGRGFELLALDEGEGTSRGVTDDSIAIGGLASETLVGAPFRLDVCTGAAARFDQANLHDELSRTIEFAGCYDDRGQNERSSLLTTGLVRDEVFAAVPIGTSSFLAHDLLEAEQIPYIGWDKLPGFCGRTNPIGFGTTGARGCPVLDARGFVTFVEPVLTAYSASLDQDGTVERMTYVVTDDPEGQAAAASRSFEAELSATEAPTVLALLPNTVTDDVVDWADISETVLATEPEVVVLDGPNIDGLPATLRSEGFEGEVVVVGIVDPLDVANQAFRSELGPVTVISPGVDLANRGAPGWESIVGAAASVGISQSRIGSDFVLGYLAADFFVHAVRATPEPLTAENLADTVNGGWWYPGVRGVACGSWWPASHYIAVPCVSVSRVDVETPFLVPVQGLVETAPQFRFHLSE